MSRLAGTKRVGLRVASIGVAPEQAGAIPWRWSDRGPEILLITSSGGDRWIVPKGWIEAGASPAQCAVDEAFEEAGVRGVLSSNRPLGVVGFKSGRRQRAIVVFLLEVLKVHERWPDEELRRRAWLSPERAAGKVRDSGLRELISRVGERLVRTSRSPKRRR